MQRDVIRLREQIVERRQHHVRPVFEKRLRGERFVRQHLHADADCPGGHGLADAAQPHDADGRTHHAGAVGPFPLAVAHAAVGHREVAGHAKEQGQSVLRDRMMVDAGSRHYDDARRITGGQVNRVVANARAGDGSQPGQSLDDVAGVGLGPGDDGVGRRQSQDELIVVPQIHAPRHFAELKPGRLQNVEMRTGADVDRSSDNGRHKSRHEVKSGEKDRKMAGRSYARSANVRGTPDIKRTLAAVPPVLPTIFRADRRLRLDLLSRLDRPRCRENHRVFTSGDAHDEFFLDRARFFRGREGQSDHMHRLRVLRQLGHFEHAVA